MSQAKMRVAKYNNYGSPDVVFLTSAPVPTLNTNEVLIETRATTVSTGDWRARSLELPKGMTLIGRLFFGIVAPKRKILGTELSGKVVKVGASVTKFNVGDEVIGFPGANFGAHAELVAMAEDGPIVHKPAALSFETATAIPFGFTAAYDFLVQKGKLKTGERILINGATGATGSACVQIAKQIGAHVTAVCSEKSIKVARQLGADEVIDYARQDFARGLQKYDVVVDTNGTAPWKRTRRALVPGGRMIMITGSFSDMLFGSLKARMVGKRLIAGVASESTDLLQLIVDLVGQGTYKPLVGKTFRFDSIVEAHRLVDTGHKSGTVVVTMAV